MKGLHLIFILALSVTVFADDKVSEKKIFETGSSVFEKRKEDILTIRSAKALEIQVSGEINQAEMLKIYENDPKKEWEKIFQGQGILTLTHPLIVIDNEILVILTTKDKLTRKGATVKISELKSEKLLEYVRKEIADIFNKLEKDEIIEKIDHNIREGNEILKRLETILDRLQKQDSQNKNEEIRELSKGLRNLVEQYHNIVEQKKALNESHLFLQKKLRRLATNSKKWSKYLESTLKKKSNVEKSLVKQQSASWSDAEKTLKYLSEQIGICNKTLNELFNAIEENAQLFYETANTVDLNQNPLGSVLNELADFKPSLDNLSKNWQTIHHIKESLKSNGFL